MEESKIYEFYNQTFKLIYADLVALTGVKYPEIIFEIEACFSHIAVAKTSDDNREKLSNFEKAHGHLLRASIDASKLIWFEYLEQSKNYSRDPDLLVLGTNTTSLEVNEKFRLAQELSINARKNEVQQTGKNLVPVLHDWHTAIEALKDFIECFDQEKVTKVKKDRNSRTKRERCWDFALGCAASFVVFLLTTDTTQKFITEKSSYVMEKLAKVEVVTTDNQ